MPETEVLTRAEGQRSGQRAAHGRGAPGVARSQPRRAAPHEPSVLLRGQKDAAATNLKPAPTCPLEPFLQMSTCSAIFRAQRGALPPGSPDQPWTSAPPWCPAPGPSHPQSPGPVPPPLPRPPSLALVLTELRAAHPAPPLGLLQAADLGLLCAPAQSTPSQQCLAGRLLSMATALGAPKGRAHGHMCLTLPCPLLQGTGRER